MDINTHKKIDRNLKTMTCLFEKTEINGLVLKNRFIRSATWEGLAADDEGAVCMYNFL